MNTHPSVQAAAQKAEHQAKIEALLKELNTFLVAGVQAQLSWSQGTPLITFSVRYMQNGKRHSLGVFNTYDGAVNALITHKYKHAISLSTKEINSRMEQILLSTADRTTTLLSNALTTVSSTAKDVHFSQQAKVDLTMMEHIYSNVSIDKFDSGKPFDYFYQAAEGEEGQMITVTPKMVKAFYENMNRKAQESKLAREESQQASMKEQKEKESELPELSDEEYNKLLGLDDDD